MEGVIKIEGYRVHCVIGSHVHERGVEQELSLDIEMKIDISECVQTDCLADTVDYNKIVEICAHLAKTRQYHLIETFAYESVHALMGTFSPVRVKICVKKKHALYLASAAACEIELQKP